MPGPRVLDPRVRSQLLAKAECVREPSRHVQAAARIPISTPVGPFHLFPGEGRRGDVCVLRNARRLRVRRARPCVWGGCSDWQALPDCHCVTDSFCLLRGKGPLKNTSDVISAAKKIAEAGSRMDKLGRTIADQVSSSICVCVCVCCVFLFTLEKANGDCTVDRFFS